MNGKKKDRWAGPERRTCPNAGHCLDHTGLVQRVESSEHQIKAFENRNFVPFTNYKWTFGILSSILISLFSIAIYLAFNTYSEVNKISVKQETTYYKITVMQQDIEELKDETNDIKRQLDKNHP